MTTEAPLLAPSSDATAVTPEAWRTLAVSSLAVLAAFLDTTVLFVAFPDIVQSFDTVPTNELSWVLNAYTIVLAALLVPIGKLADRVGHKRAFIAGSAVFTLASMACGLAPTAATLIALRIVQAVGAATLIPSSLALVLRAFPPAKVPMAVAVWGATGAVAGALGPTLGAAVVEAASWRWVFFLNLPVGIVTVVLGSRTLRESSDTGSSPPDPIGVLLVIVAASSIALGIVQSDVWGVADPRTVIAIGLGATSLVGFVAHQRATTRPAIDLDLFRVRNFAWGNAATLAFGTAFASMFFSSILFLTDVWGYSIMRAGFAVAPGPLLVAILAPRLGSLAGRIGQRPLLLAGGVTFAIGGLWRLVALGASPAYVADYLPSMLFTGLGVALCLPQLSSVVAQALPPGQLGVGGGVNQAIRQFGGTLGVALTIGLLGSPSGLGEALSSFDTVWWLIVLGGLATTVLAVPLSTVRRLG
jgi:EmrB/QacA subfamily drug resistance transporter